MCDRHICRRDALRLAGSGLFAGLMSGWQVTSAADPPAARPSYYRKINYTYDTSFNKTQLKVIRDAVDIVANRMLDPRMFKNANTTAKKWYTEVPDMSFKNYTEFTNWFTRVQLPVLREKGFPNLRLHEVYAKDAGWAGQAYTGTMKTYYTAPNDGFSLREIAVVEGTFDIDLNSYLLGDNKAYPDLGTDAAYWAGVITHEMLHNLGHQHPDGTYEGVFIRDYQNAVRFNGNYKPGLSLTGSNEVVGCVKKKKKR